MPTNDDFDYATLPEPRSVNEEVADELGLSPEQAKRLGLDPTPMRRNCDVCGGPPPYTNDDSSHDDCAP